jgi:hypothetical protein
VGIRIPDRVAVRIPVQVGPAGEADRILLGEAARAGVVVAVTAVVLAAGVAAVGQEAAHPRLARVELRGLVVPVEPPARHGPVHVHAVRDGAPVLVKRALLARETYVMVLLTRLKFFVLTRGAQQAVIHPRPESDHVREKVA